MTIQEIQFRAVSLEIVHNLEIVSIFDLLVSNGERSSHTRRIE